MAAADTAHPVSSIPITNERASSYQGNGIDLLYLQAKDTQASSPPFSLGEYSVVTGLIQVVHHTADSTSTLILLP